MGAGGAQRRGKIRLADASQNDRISLPVIFLLGRSGELEIHQPLMSGVSDQGCAASSIQSDFAAADGNGNIFSLATGGSVEKISDRLPDLAALVRVCNQVHVLCAMLEDASFKDLRPGLLSRCHQLPVC